ncbi:insert subdomain of RNA polymerase alpha subunit [Sesbania bispinosa]|nr:insert subdomain of RNA polymerase alpha subunit [Sesbania bispinosa]
MGWSVSGGGGATGRSASCGGATGWSARRLQCGAILSGLHGSAVPFFVLQWRCDAVLIRLAVVR